ncbi:conserved hypothetical protein [Formosa agariphila KMM 3901]|uniref:Uncharacterized protein n=1 Tax=Formosa agariphila (strain DSM 15362 / KCTC 12365 / LMG 23005 / KMM 3901 / M-2Alg 35-1) TaxID=1347342 RepID=T2KNU1_FORAG|nr:hypothetical protein [Formosa agariphila]CDF79664.1 conserved hypothetical protein [Formosa agariphila KMM 3901]
MSPKKILKIVAGIIVFFTLPTLLFFGYIYFKYNEDLPQGTPTEAADTVANKMLEALDYEAYKNTNYIEWTFNKRHHFKWKKNENFCEVYWKDIKVDLNINAPHSSMVTISNDTLQTADAKEYIDKAVEYFNNDSFWLIAPYKVFDAGTTRSLIPLENNQQGLLISYASGGSTPGDSYMWLLDNDYKPTAFKMWVSILPIEGLEATWSNWKTTETGAQLPEFHKLLFLGLEITDIKTAI